MIIPPKIYTLATSVADDLGLGSVGSATKAGFTTALFGAKAPPLPADFSPVVALLRTIRSSIRKVQSAGPALRVQLGAEPASLKADLPDIELQIVEPILANHLPGMVPVFVDGCGSTTPGAAPVTAMTIEKSSPWGGSPPQPPAARRTSARTIRT